MKAAIADAVHPIFNAGISLRDRLEASEPLEWACERKVLQELLSAVRMDEPVANSAGPDEIAFDFSMPDDPAERHRLTLETIRYALTCWLDEFLGRYSAWGMRWRQEPLLAELFDAPTSINKFWDEARYAQTRGDLDTLEVMYWCAMLGFRGAWRGKPEQLEAWTMRVRTLLEDPSQTWTMPACLAPSARESKMPGDLPYRSMMFSVLLAIGLTAPLALVFVWRLWLA